MSINHSKESNAVNVPTLGRVGVDGIVKSANEAAQFDSKPYQAQGKQPVEGGVNRPTAATMTPEARAARDDVLDWVEHHRGTFRRMEAIAAECIAECESRGKRNHLSMQYLTEQVRREGIRIGIGDTFAINNNLRAGLARYMVSLHPSWADYFDMRRSKADGAFEVEE